MGEKTRGSRLNVEYMCNIASLVMALKRFDGKVNSGY